MRGESGREPEPGRPRTCVRGCVRVRVTSNAFLVSPALRAPPVPRRKGPIRFRLASGEDGRRRDRVPDLTVLSWLDQNSSNSASNSKGDRTQVHGTKLWFYTDGCMASFSSEASFIFIRSLGVAIARADLRFAQKPQWWRMSGTLGKVLGLWTNTVSKQGFSLQRFRILGENPIYSAGGIVRTSRHYKTKPTHGIGRYRHLVKVLEPKKKKAKVELRAINVGTDYEYGVLNIHLTAYDMTLAESYARYVHRLCNQLSIKVEESYAMPTKTMEVMRLPDQGNKMVLDSVLTTHERVVQISGLSATFAEIFLEILQINLPEGVRLSVREHTEEDFKGRFKARPELEELLAKLN
uniref:Mitochondrial ribosomal protein L48 n=2 Tax=Rattus norvegicus TaxID=10116 RepID=A0A8I5Y9S3_RAT